LIAVAALLLTPSAASAAWTGTPTPNLDGAHLTGLPAVDCSSAYSCMAVGHAENGPAPGYGVTIAERWNGTSWQIVPTPNPPGKSSSLDGVSCPRPSVCFAVGSSWPGFPLVELWNGTSWSIQPSPAVPGGSLADVDCSGLLACTAVGNADVGAFAERWEGSGWHVQPTPNADRSSLYGVSCPLRRTCTAVGSSMTGNVESPLVERWFGRVNAWGLQAAPQPEGAESVGLGDVSCPDGRLCVVVGSSTAHQGQSSVMAARRFGLGNWSIFPLIALSGSSLSAVDCPARHFCQATGRWGSGLIAERFDGASWQVEGIATPGLTTPFPGDISCSSRFFCMAVGGWMNMEGVGGTLAAKWTP
jgi:hypothetical protein